MTLESYRRHRRGWEERGRSTVSPTRRDEYGCQGAAATRSKPSPTQRASCPPAVKVEGSAATIRLAQGQPQEIQFLTAAGETSGRGSRGYVGDQQWLATSTDRRAGRWSTCSPDRPVAFGLTTAEGQLETGSLEGLFRRANRGTRRSGGDDPSRARVPGGPGDRSRQP